MNNPQIWVSAGLLKMFREIDCQQRQKIFYLREVSISKEEEWTPFEISIEIDTFS